jgi:hypothetical protein
MDDGALSPAEMKFRSRKRLWVFFLVLVIVLFLTQMAAVAGLLGMVIFRGFDHGFTMPYDEQDRAVVIHIEDLVPEDAQFSATVRKWRGHRGAVHVKSDGEAEVEGREVRLYCEAVLARGEGEAERLFYRHSETRPAMLTIDPDAELGSEARSDLLAWGDQSVLYTLNRDGRPAGIFFVARRGERVFALAIAGRKLDDPRLVEMLLRPVLTEFERYEG